LCLKNDKQKKESALHFTHNGRNQETRGNYNEKFLIKKMKIVKKITLKKNRMCCINCVVGEEHKGCQRRW
jgi:hypothetical protein